MYPPINATGNPWAEYLAAISARQVFIPPISTPFSNTAEIPYYIKEKNGDVPYAYHHLQDFTSNIGEFQRATENAKLTQNVDSPEAGLDALMQAIVCKGNCCLNSRTQHSLHTLFIYGCILGHR